LLINSIGLKEFTSEESITIYPNPTRSFIQWELTDSELGNLSSITILNALAQEIMQVNSTEKTADFSSFESGIYFIVMDFVGEKRITQIAKL